MAIRRISVVPVRCIASNKTQKVLCVPRNDKQRKYIELLEQDRPCIVVAYGTAGSAKTQLAVEMGIKKLLSKQVERIVITRPAVGVDDEQHGFLPGSIEAKMKPWVLPVYDALSHHFDSQQIDRMIKNRVVEFAPLAFMRGRTFENAWIIVDEAQNTTKNQMIMMLTRIGKNSKMVFTGDPCQHDRRNDSGLNHFLDLIDSSVEPTNPDVRVIEFDECDVERHHIIPYILRLYASRKD